MFKKRKLFLFLIGIGVFIICFVLIYNLGSSSLPKTSNQRRGSLSIAGGDSVKIQNDLTFFWPLTLTENYDHAEGDYGWIYADCPPNCSPTEHPFVLLYWALVSVIISLIVVLVVRIFLKGRK